jgi:hypothetical protein
MRSQLSRFGGPEDPPIEKIDCASPCADQEDSCKRFVDGVSFKVAVDDPSDTGQKGENSPLPVHYVQQPFIHSRDFTSLPPSH